MIFSVLVLGSGAATPTFSRNCSSQVVTVGSKKFLIDCGEGTQNQLRQFHQHIQSFDTIFISHLHGDHFFGLPGLLSTMHLCGRKESVTIYAPKGLKKFLDVLFDVSGTALNYELHINEIDTETPCVIHDSSWCKVTAIPLCHSVPTYGFIFEENAQLLNLRKNVRQQYNMTNKDCMDVKRGSDLILPDGSVVANKDLTLPPHKARRYAYCCDTGLFEGLTRMVEDADLLCLESTFDDSFSSLAESRQHLTAAQAAKVAAEANVKQLMLTHFSARYRDVEPLLNEARAFFPNTIPASDGVVVEIPMRH